MFLTGWCDVTCTGHMELLVTGALGVEALEQLYLLFQFLICFLTWNELMITLNYMHSFEMRKIFLQKMLLLSKSGLLRKWTGSSCFVTSFSSIDLSNLLWSSSSKYTSFVNCYLNYLICTKGAITQKLFQKSLYQVS